MHSNQAHHFGHTRLIGIFCLCAFLFALAGYVMLESIKEHEKNDTNKMLAGIGQLKSAQIQSYLSERKGDAAVISSFLSSPSAQYWLANPGGDLPAALNLLTESIVRAYQYRGALLLDANANIRLDTAHSGTLTEAGKAIALRAMRERTPATFQIYLGDPSTPDVPVLDTFVPVMSSDKTRVAGMVVLRNEMNFLFSLIQSWPEKSATAESLLVTKDGGDVLFLNELRNSKGSALKLRVPLNSSADAPAWPAISAMRGNFGLFEANDYRGKRVLAYTLAVPDTPWGMVVKMDMAEAVANGKNVQQITQSIVLFFIAFAGLLSWQWWRRDRVLQLANEQLWQAQDRLLQSEKLLNEAQKSAHLGGWERNLMTDSVNCSAEFFRILELDPIPPDFSFAEYMLAVHPEDREVVDHAYMTSIRTRQPFDLVHRLQLADGRVKWVNERGTFYYDDQGVPWRSSGTLQDITERKKSEELAQQFGRLLQNSFNEIYLFDAHSLRFILCSEGAQKNLGYSADELSQLTPLDIKPLLTRESFERIIAPLHTGEQKSLLLETVHRRKDGTTYPVEIRLQYMPGEAPTYLAIIQDISERKRMEEEMQRSEIKFRTLYESSSDAILMLGEQGFTDCNFAALRMFGCPSRDDLISKHPSQFSPPTQPGGRDSMSLAQERIAAALNNGSNRFDWLHRRLDGSEFMADVLLSSMNLNGKQVLQGIVRDITSRKQAEEALRKSHDELEAINLRLRDAQNLLLQSEKMASVGQLAAGVAHEINNPIGYVGSNLGALDGYLKELFEVVATYEEMEHAVDDSTVLARVKAVKDKVDLEFLKEDVSSLMRESQEGIIRVKKIVQDLKDFSRVDTSDQWHFANLHQGLDSTLNVASNEIKYKAEVKKEYGDIPDVECLPSQLNQVFMNLLVNAAHAIQERGTITLRSGRQGEEVWVEVEDTGKGIAPENLSRIFDPFFTTKPVGQGTGLGLSLSYSIIQKHHGRIEVSSEVGKGTVFRVWLPVKQQH